MFRKKKGLIKWVLVAMMTITPALSSLISTSALDNSENVIQSIDPYDVEDASISDDMGSLQIQKYSSNTGIEDISYLRWLKDAEFTIYSNPELTDVVTSLTTDESGFTESYEVLPGTYYVIETQTSLRYSQDKTVHEVSVQKGIRHIETFKSDPQLTTISQADAMNADMESGRGLPVHLIARATSHTVTTTTEYGTWNLSGSGAYGQQTVLKIDGKYAFCLEGNKSEVEGSNAEVAWTTLGMNGYKEKLVLMAYYGYYSQPSANNYYLTQNLIWDEIMRVQQSLGWQVYATNSTYSSLSSMQSFFTTVRNKVNSFYTKPSFNGTTITATPGQAISIADSNKVLSDCYVNSKGSTNASISSNTLKVTAPTTPGTYTITLKRGASSLYSGTLFAVRYSSSAQAMSTLQGGITWDAKVTIKVEEQTGKLTLTKASTNTALTSSNSCYSLSGAVYGVYTESACTNKVGELTTDASGKTNTLELEAGTYYIKEITAPKGYVLDTAAHKVTVTSGETATFSASDIPQSDPVSVLLEKVDADTGQSVPVNNGSLADAEFTFKFYAGEYGDNVDPNTQGATPTRTWILKTDANGVARLKDSYLVSGDAFYMNSLGVATLPLGVLTIQETKAPVGYHLNNTVYVRKITSSGTTESVSTYNYPVVKENAIKFKIEKVQSGTDIHIAGVTFTHIKPDGSSETLTTNDDGVITIEGLSKGVHSLKESSTISGLEINPNEFKFEVLEDGSVQAKTTITTDMGLKFSTDSNKNGVLVVSNDTAAFSVKIQKTNGSKLLDGAEFTLYSNASCTQQVQKGETVNGILTFGNLEVGTKYYLKETKAPQGYRLEDNPHVYEIYVDSSIPSQGIFDFYVDGQKYTTTSTSGSISLTGTSQDRVILLNIVNQISVVLPETGSPWMLPMSSLGILLTVSSLTCTKMEKEKKKKGNK